MKQGSRKTRYACKDAYPLSMTLFEPGKKHKGTVVIAGAIGVSQTYYERFASYLAEQGHLAITFDYRGTGQSDEPLPVVALKEWGEQDIDAAIQLALSYEKPVYFIGHSIGGQLVGFAPLAEKLDSMIFVAASAPYWKRWAFPENTKMLFTSTVLLPSFASMTDDFPTRRFGLGNIDVPSQAILEWASWMRQPNYLFDEKFKLGTEGYGALRQRILSLGFEDDHMAPRKNVEHLLKFFPNCFPILKMVGKESVGDQSIGHTGSSETSLKTNFGLAV